MRLKGKVVLIGGAGSNMSRATALLFAQEGAKVALAARTTEKMEETAKRIRANGGNVLTHQTDLTDAAQVESLIDAVVSNMMVLTALFTLQVDFSQLNTILLQWIRSIGTVHCKTTCEPFLTQCVCLFRF